MNPNDVAVTIVALALLFTTGAVLIFRGALGKAIAKRIEGTSGGSAELEGRVRDLEDRLHQVELDRGELLERLDFAERMLLQGREATKELPR